MLIGVSSRIQVPQPSLRPDLENDRSSYILDLRAKIGNQLLLLPSVAAVVHDGDGRLLLQRKAGSEGWSLPAGATEPGEAPHDALRREVLEETGRAIVTSEIIGVFGGEEFRYTYPNGHQLEYTVILFQCMLEDEASHPVDAETVELRYFARSEMPALALPYPMELLFHRRAAVD